MTELDSNSVGAARPVKTVARDAVIDDGLRMRQVSQILDVPQPTIRSWERRYGLPLANRSSGGHRRFTGKQVDQLRWMRDLIGQGHSAAEAAAVVNAGHLTSPAPLVEAFLQAARELAPGGIAAALDGACETVGLARTIDEVLLPAMLEVGDWWYTAEIDVGHEHLATNATRAWLAGIHATGPWRRQPPIILGCGPLDDHTLGLEAIAALLRQRHWDCRLLAARTPAASLAHAVAQTDAPAIVLLCHVTTGRTAALQALQAPELRHRHVFYAGSAFASAPARHGVPGHYLGTNLARATDLITTTVASRRG